MMRAISVKYLGKGRGLPVYIVDKKICFTNNQLVELSNQLIREDNSVFHTFSLIQISWNGLTTTTRNVLELRKIMSMQTKIPSHGEEHYTS